MGLLDTILGGNESESQSFIDPNQAEYLKQIYGDAASIYGGSQTNPFFQQSFNQMMPQINQGLLSTLRGDFLPGGEAFESQMRSIGNTIRPQLASQFGTAGRFGSGLHKIGYENRMMDAGANLYSQERGRQLGLMAQAPDIMSNMAQSYYGLPYQRMQPFRQAIGAPTVLNRGTSSSTQGLGGLIGFNYELG
jgi:hypothetical protein